jgi:hypothetical protein
MPVACSNSEMAEKYIHYFGNESCEGIVTKNNTPIDILNPKICPNCNEGNTQDAKFCSKCEMIMSFEGYQEALESQKEKESEVQNLKDQMRLLEESQKEILQCLKYPEKLAQIAREG